MKKYHLVPYRENIPEILKEDEEPDDIKLKKIIQTLHKMLRPYNSDTANIDDNEVKAAPITEERATQTSEEQRGEDDDLTVVVNYLSKTYRQKGRSLLNLLKPVLAWDPQTLEILIDDKPLQGSNIVDMTSYLVSRSKKLPVPSHFDRVMTLLVKQNLPVSIVNHERFKRRTVKARATIRRGASSSVTSPKRLRTVSPEQRTPTPSPITSSASVITPADHVSTAPRTSKRLLDKAWKKF